MRINKLPFTLAIALILGGYAHAQISEGGQPYSRDVVNYADARQYVPQVALPLPDMAAILRDDSIEMNKPLGEFHTGKAVNADISFASSGIMTTLANGNKIWRLQVRMTGAQALGLYYDSFHLPDGVKYFLYNENGKQLLGAYTADNNTDATPWVNEKVQGEVINLEVDIPADVDPARIYFHINHVVVFYNAIGYLQQYSNAANARETNVGFDYKGSAGCEVNAACQTNPDFMAQRKATVHLEYLNTNGSTTAGTATLINNVRQDCKPYLLTASHNEGTNSTSNTTFATWVFYFNYETPTCISPATQPASTSMTGAKFRSRSKILSNGLVGDFLLLELNSIPPAAWNIYYSGWDRSGSTESGTFVSFHHPVGDVKKVSTATQVTPDGDWGVEPNSHWDVILATGATESGSSGCGLFDPNGRLIGSLTGGVVADPSCPNTHYTNPHVTTYNENEYSKFSLNWEYMYQTPSSAATRLKDWLDPDNTGATTLDATTAACAPVAVPQATVAASVINVFPNPTTGIVYAKVVLDKPTYLKIEVFNITGAKQTEIVATDAVSGNYKIDLSQYANGMYMIVINAGNTIITKKVTLTK